jgi:hypothetical protein
MQPHPKLYHEHQAQNKLFEFFVTVDRDYLVLLKVGDYRHPANGSFSALVDGTVTEERHYSASALFSKSAYYFVAIFVVLSTSFLLL